MEDEQFDQPGSIDLLIGADLFYEIIQSGRRTRPGNFPVLQETVLGWTISGRTPDTNQNEPQHTSVTRRQPEIQLEPLLGSGSSGAIQHDSRATSLRRTSKQDGTHSH